MRALEVQLSIAMILQVGGVKQNSLPRADGSKVMVLLSSTVFLGKPGILSS